MTDNEIIKALECCLNDETALCNKCPLKNECDDNPLDDVKARYSLDLINRQQAEIENYSHNVKQLVSDIRNYQIDLQAMRISANSFKSKYKSAINTAKELQTVIKEKDAEIETLKAEQMMADGYADALVEITKAEAIKEFAERLKYDMVPNIDDTYIESFVEEYIDNLVKEMVGENNV
jgi:SMC interacting uncharacterized protein involved in chromosome segregation